MRKLPTAIGAALAALALTTGPVVTAAAAAPVPVVYNYAEGWSHPSVRPAWIYVGQGGSPMVHAARWSSWNYRDAKSAGTLVTDNCVPNCALGTAGYHKLTVTLSGVKYHNGQPYYSVMTWDTPGYRIYGYKNSIAVLHFGVLPGASVPFWQ